jgi:nitroreductase
MNETLQTIHCLCTTHGNFQNRPLPRETVETIFAASIRAANAGNAQNYAIIVVEDPAVMKDAAGSVAPVMLLYCVDLQRNIDLAHHLGCQYSGAPAWTVVTGTTDAALAAQTAVIAARSLGIDSLLTNGVQRGDPRRIWKLLDLPARNCFPVVAVYLVYATGQPEARKGRLGEPGVIHRGRYHHRDQAALNKVLELTDAPEFCAPIFAKWREEGHAHYLEAFFKGPGGRAATMYGGLDVALAEAGIQITATPDRGVSAT